MNSLWQDTNLPTFPKLRGDRTTDVLVIGGGIAGLLCARLLTDAGVNTMLVEENRICSGITKDTTAKITSQHGLIYHNLLHDLGAERTRMYLQANEAALEKYRQICKELPCHFEVKSNYVYNLTDPAPIEQELQAVRRLGFPADFREELPLPFSIAGAVKFRHQAQFQPLEFAAGIAKDLTIFERTSVRSLHGTTAVTDTGRIKAEKVIVATHFPFWNRHGSYYLKLYQQRSYVLALKNGPDLHGMYICGEEGGYSFRNAGDCLLLGGNHHRTGKKSSGWAPLEALAEACYPHAEPAFRWATQDCISLDGVPYIGHYSANTPNVYVATGFNKWGMSSAMVSAMLLTDQILGRNNPFAPVFNPSRGMLNAQLAANAGAAVSNLLRPTAPRCPHMGCALKWNSRERSWDCSCHGSRFDEKGKKLTNPANKDMRR